MLSIVNPPDNQERRAIRLQEKLTFPILFDCGQVSASYLKVTPRNPQFEIPHIFLIDREGTIRNDYGYSPETRDIFEGRALFEELDRMSAERRGIVTDIFK